MLILISPAKTLDFDTPTPIDRFSQPDFLDDTAKLVKQLKQLSAPEVSSLMKISDKLGELNSDRFQAWQPNFDDANAKQALLAFQGDVYQGMQVNNYQPEDFEFAQEHLRILSGLYGVLRPLDLIQPYRLEMGTKLAHAKLQDLAANTLYEFWADKLTQTLNRQLEQLDQKIIINLASNEYFKAVKPKLLEAEIITPAFKDWKSDATHSLQSKQSSASQDAGTNSAVRAQAEGLPVVEDDDLSLRSAAQDKGLVPKGLASRPRMYAHQDNGKYKTISFYAKKARGMMTSYIIKNRLTKVTDLRNFAEAGYSYNSELSDPENPTFTRQLED